MSILHELAERIEGYKRVSKSIESLAIEIKRDTETIRKYMSHVEKLYDQMMGVRSQIFHQSRVVNTLDKTLANISQLRIQEHKARAYLNREEVRISNKKTDLRVRHLWSLQPLEVLNSVLQEYIYLKYATEELILYMEHMAKDIESAYKTIRAVYKNKFSPEDLSTVDAC